MEISVKQMKKALKKIVKSHRIREDKRRTELSTISVRALTKGAAAQLADEEWPTTQKHLLRRRLKSVLYSDGVKGIKEIKNKKVTLTGGV